MNCCCSVKDVGDQDHFHMQLMTGKQEIKDDFDGNLKAKWNTGV
jgi:hypothetical protein